MSSGRHVSLHSLSLLDVHNDREEEGFAMLATEVARYDMIEVCKVRLALLTKASLGATYINTDINNDSGGVPLTLQPKIFCALRYVLYVRPIFLTLPLFNVAESTNDKGFQKIKATR